MKKLYIAFIFFSSIIVAKAQSNLNLYNFRNVGQSNLINPGIRPQANVTVGLMGTYNSAQLPEITLSDIFNKDQNADSTIKKITRDPNLSFNSMGISTVLTPFSLVLLSRKIISV
jgi:hypothetical protein